MITNPPIKIALADDHALFRKGMALLLESLLPSNVIIEAENGIRLLEQLECTTSLPDICLLDINMPVMNGFDTAKELASRYPQIKVMALTMYESEHSIIKFINAGAYGYLLKGSDPEELETAIRTVYKGDYYYSGTVIDKITNTGMHFKPGPQSVMNAAEHNFLSHCCSELGYKEIAARMNVPLRTVEGYRDILFKKLNVHSRVGLAIYAINSGILPY